jgi:hypothetical protein
MWYEEFKLIEIRKEKWCNITSRIFKGTEKLLSAPFIAE